MKDHVARVRRSVVKILTTSDPPNYDQPWQTMGSESAHGSGCIVSTKRGLRVLTNAHVVENPVFVVCRRFGRAHKFVAQVEGVGHVCDLALLTVEDETIFDGCVPVEIGDLPVLGDDVTVLGYPIGGDRLSITQGVVSRIEMAHYAQSQRRLLAVQIDAAINAGNSGGPVIRDDKLVGVAFQALDEGQNIGYMIGAPVVQHFLQDMESGTFDGFPELGVAIQTLESNAHREYLGLPRKPRNGVLITDVAFGGSAWKQLCVGDVLMKVAGTAIAYDGSVRFRRGERIDYSHIVAQHHVGETIEVGVLRKGEEVTVQVPLSPPRPLVEENRYDVMPTYFTYAGLLFVPLTRDYLGTWGDDWWTEAPHDLMSSYLSGLRSEEVQEIVVLQKVLADQVNVGYHDWESQIVSRVGDTSLTCFEDLIAAVEACNEEFICFHMSDGHTLVIDRKKADKRASSILRRFGIPSARNTGERSTSRTRTDPVQR